MAQHLFLKSVSKLPTDEIVGSILLNQKINTNFSQEEDKLNLLLLRRSLIIMDTYYNVSF